MMEHDSGACIYGALVSVDTNDIFSNNEFPNLDVGRKIISKDNGKETIKLNGSEGERGFNVSSFMNEAISKSFEGALGIVWSRPLVIDFAVTNSCCKDWKLLFFNVAACFVAAGYLVSAGTCFCCYSILLLREDLSRNLELTESKPIVPADSSSSIPADYVSAGHVLVSADRDRIC
ncbi:hypothetical protein Tco_0726695 [Tanacetum coccineum]|uniref:Uncharacterized protein n=1 Tax=Tanacetum coccineum TaxID=301880 RepID=A0ABQ4YGA6_9ASTR